MKAAIFLVCLIGASLAMPSGEQPKDLYQTPEEQFDYDLFVCIVDCISEGVKAARGIVGIWQDESKSTTDKIFDTIETAITMMSNIARHINDYLEKKNPPGGEDYIGFLKSVGAEYDRIKASPNGDKKLAKLYNMAIKRLSYEHGDFMSFFTPTIV